MYQFVQKILPKILAKERSKSLNFASTEKEKPYASKETVSVKPDADKDYYMKVYKEFAQNLHNLLVKCTKTGKNKIYNKQRRKLKAIEDKFKSMFEQGSHLANVHYDIIILVAVNYLLLGDMYMTCGMLLSAEKYFTGIIELLKGKELDPKAIFIVLHAYHRLSHIHSDIHPKKCYTLLITAISLYIEYTKEENYPKPWTYFNILNLEDVDVISSEDLLDNDHILHLLELVKLYNLSPKDKHEFVLYMHNLLKNYMKEALLQSGHIEWSIACVSLATYFIQNNRFTEAKSHIATANKVLAEYKGKACVHANEQDASLCEYESINNAIMLLYADNRVELLWGFYGTSLLRISKERLLKEKENNTSCKVDDLNSKFPLLLFDEKVESTLYSDATKQSLDFTTFTDQYAENFNDITNVFIHTRRSLVKAKVGFKKENNLYHSSEATLYISRLYKYMSYFELDITKQVTWHNKRVKLIESAIKDLSETNDSYVTITMCQILWIELGTAYSALLDISAETLARTGEDIVEKTLGPRVSLSKTFDSFVRYLNITSDDVKIEENFRKAVCPRRTDLLYDCVPKKKHLRSVSEFDTNLPGNPPFVYCTSDIVDVKCFNILYLKNYFRYCEIYMYIYIYIMYEILNILPKIWAEQRAKSLNIASAEEVKPGDSKEISKLDNNKDCTELLNLLFELRQQYNDNKIDDFERTSKIVTAKEAELRNMFTNISKKDRDLRISILTYAAKCFADIYLMCNELSKAEKWCKTILKFIKGKELDPKYISQAITTWYLLSTIYTNSQPAKCYSCLISALRLYNKYTKREKYPTPVLYDNDIEPIDPNVLLDSFHIKTLTELIRIYKLHPRDKHEFVLYMHELLKEIMEEVFLQLGHIEWSITCANLAFYFIKNKRFREARNHLITATKILIGISEMYKMSEDEKNQDKTSEFEIKFNQHQHALCSVNLIWVQYGMELIRISKEKLLQGETTITDNSTCEIDKSNLATLLLFDEKFGENQVLLCDKTKETLDTLTPFTDQYLINREDVKIIYDSCWIKICEIIVFFRTHKDLYRLGGTILHFSRLCKSLINFDRDCSEGKEWQITRLEHLDLIARELSDSTDSRVKHICQILWLELGLAHCTSLDILEEKLVRTGEDLSRETAKLLRESVDKIIECFKVIST